MVAPELQQQRQLAKQLEEAVLELQQEVAGLILQVVKDAENNRMSKGYTHQVLVVVQLKEAEQQRVLVEMEVREEVSNEMADLLRSMEASYQVWSSGDSTPDSEIPGVCTRGP